MSLLRLRNSKKYSPAEGRVEAILDFDLGEGSILRDLRKLREKWANLGLNSKFADRIQQPSNTVLQHKHDQLSALECQWTHWDFPQTTKNVERSYWT